MIHNPDPEHQPNPRAFLEHFPLHRRSGVANMVHGSVRRGAQTPQAVLEGVRATIARALVRPDPQSLAHFTSVLEALETDEAGARAYAPHVLGYEELLREQRQRAKAERTFHYMTEAMRTRPVTAPQPSYLAALGWQGEPPANRAGRRAS